jgi:hypothetical protein
MTKHPTTDADLVHLKAPLRHAYITRVWKAGASPIVARSLARHSDLRETMRYSHVTREEQRKIADNLSGIPKPPKPDDRHGVSHQPFSRVRCGNENGLPGIFSTPLDVAQLMHSRAGENSKEP